MINQEHGGKRKGAGRPVKPFEKRLTRVSVTLPRDVIRRIRRRGGGNLSAGIRVLVEEASSLPDEGAGTSHLRNAMNLYQGSTPYERNTAPWQRLGFESEAAYDSYIAEKYRDPF